MSWKEYDIDDEDIAEWLPWEGIVRPTVMKNKDGSFFGVIEYIPYISSEKIKYCNYQNGWNIWSEKQHRQGNDRYFLTISWNPIYDRALKAENTLTACFVDEKKATDYFAEEIQTLTNDITAVTTCHLLEYQEILDFLSFTLSFGENSVILPENSLYLDLDILLSQDLNVKFLGNDISMNEKTLLVLTLPSILEMSIMNILYKAFAGITYRYVQRILLFGKKMAQEDLEKYVSNWCNGRKSLRETMTANLLSNLNGYYTASLFFLLSDDDYDKIRDYCKEILNTLEIPYFLENYNLKDVWWGSIPGIFRANINAPITGFSSLDELLVQRENEEEVNANVSLEPV